MAKADRTKGCKAYHSNYIEYPISDAMWQSWVGMDDLPPGLNDAMLLELHNRALRDGVSYKVSQVVEELQRRYGPRLDRYFARKGN